jgi:hypothetical protein
MIVIRGKECWPSRGVATLINLGRNTMMRELRSKGVLGKDNTPTSAYSGHEYFVVERTDRGFVTYYTSSGVEFVRRMLENVPRKPAGYNPKPSNKNLPQELLDIL